MKIVACGITVGKKKKVFLGKVQSRVFVGRKRVVERPDSRGGVVRVEGDVCHERASTRVLAGISWIGGSRRKDGLWTTMTQSRWVRDCGISVMGFVECVQIKQEMRGPVR